MERLIRLVAATGFLVLVALPAAAQYPTKPIRLIAPFRGADAPALGEGIFFGAETGQ